MNNLLDIVNQAKDLSKNLECYGYTRVLNYLLNQNEIEHKVMMGTADYNGIHIPLHYWIDLGNFIIDNKTRMYFGNEAPEGLFRNSPIKYNGEEVAMDTTKTIFDVLTFDDSQYRESFKKLIDGQGKNE